METARGEQPPAIGDPPHTWTPPQAQIQHLWFTEAAPRCFSILCSPPIHVPRVMLSPCSQDEEHQEGIPDVLTWMAWGGICFFSICSPPNDASASVPLPVSSPEPTEHRPVAGSSLGFGGDEREIPTAVCHRQHVQTSPHHCPHPPPR